MRIRRLPFRPSHAAPFSLEGHFEKKKKSRLHKSFTSPRRAGLLKYSPFLTPQKQIIYVKAASLSGPHRAGWEMGVTSRRRHRPWQSPWRGRSRREAFLGPAGPGEHLHVQKKSVGFPQILANQAGRWELEGPQGADEQHTQSLCPRQGRGHLLRAGVNERHETTRTRGGRAPSEGCAGRAWGGGQVPRRGHPETRRGCLQGRGAAGAKVCGGDQLSGLGGQRPRRRVSWAKAAGDGGGGAGSSPPARGAWGPRPR